MKRLFFLLVIILISLNSVVIAECPSFDLSDDCKFDLKDLSIISSGWLTNYSDTDLLNMSAQWLTEGVPDDPAVMNWISINDPGVDLDGDGTPDHESFVGQISKYETTNAQYCQFLNSSLATGDITVGANNVVYGANGSNYGNDFVGLIYFETYPTSFYSEITFDGSAFAVRNRDGFDMSNHPVVEVSWYGASAFCDYYGYSLPTEWQWQAVADHDGSYNYGCGTVIDFGKANYYQNGYANPLGLSSYPYTNPVDYYPSFGYGVNDMSGNVWEWTSSSDSEFTYVVRGGSWLSSDYNCTVAVLYSYYPTDALYSVGFRVCR